MHFIIPYLERVERLCTTPYKWNCKERKFVPIGNQSYVKKFRLLTYLAVAHLGLMCWNIVHVLLIEQNSILVMWGLFTFAVTFVLTVIRTVHYAYGGKIAELHNSCLRFHTLHGQAGEFPFHILLSKFDNNSKSAGFR
jgi:hypothetical protein